MKKQSGKVIVPILVILALAILFVINGVSVDIPGVVCLTTQYRSDPVDAFRDNAEDAGDAVEITDRVREITTVKADDHNAFLIAENKNGDLVVANLKVRGEKYHSGESVTVYSPETIRKGDDFEISAESVSRFSSGIRYSGTIKFAVMNKDDAGSGEYETVDIPSPFDGYVFCYKLCDK